MSVGRNGSTLATPYGLRPLVKVAIRVEGEKQSGSCLHRATPAEPGDPILTGEPSAQSLTCSVQPFPSQPLAPRTKPNLTGHKGLGREYCHQELCHCRGSGKLWPGGNNKCSVATLSELIKGRRGVGAEDDDQDK